METNSVDFFKKNNGGELKTVPIVAGWNINNPTNIGSLIRLADNAGAEVVYILDNAEEKKLSKIKKSAGLSFKNIALEFVSSNDFFNNLPQGYDIVAIETASNSTDLYETKLPEKVAFLVGSEQHGIPENLLQNCNQTVHIPMKGKCFSMNVSHALTVCLFEWIRQKCY